MSPARCRVCLGSLQPHDLDGGEIARPVSVRLTVRAAGRRMGDFELCGRCSQFAQAPERAEKVQRVLLAELRALLQ